MPFHAVRFEPRQVPDFGSLSGGTAFHSRHKQGEFRQGVSSTRLDDKSCVGGLYLLAFFFVENELCDWNYADLRVH